MDFQGLLPKKETQSLQFSKSYDGTGVVIAILDTGVDPAAPGLKTTTSGLNKITHIIDCTGTGDVCGTMVMIDDKRSVLGLSGKELKLGDWKIKDNKIYLGLKVADDLFPKALVERLSKEKRLLLDVQHAKLVTETNRLLEDAKKKLANANKEEKEDCEKWVEEFKARLDFLKEQIKAYETTPLVYDCIWFNDGNVWRAVIDTEFSGDLSKYQPLAEYSLEKQYSCFGIDSMLTFSVNFYDEGSVLSIVTTSGAHGTHVAAISAAYFPDQEDLNGVAPGAQIVSLKIGDNRLGSMETGRGLVRAAIEMVRLNVDIANMSYGEACSMPNYGTFLNLLTKEVINKANIVFVTSAGNAGPALSTVGAPGGFASGVISVGAYVTSSMMEAEYALLENVTERPYTWSSRGPALDGDFGVDIYAPGAAITSVPQFTIQNAQLMNGTSMASPNCCGCISLLLSALKSEKRPYTPYLIKRAIQNSGKDIGDDLFVKFIQVVDAWEYLGKISNLPNFHLDYSISIGHGRGVYLRNPEETSRLNSFNVSITPTFPKNDHPSQNEAKLKMEVKLEFKSSHSWIKTPKKLHLNSGGRAFGFHVDPTYIEPGAYFGRINAYDVENAALGPLFSIPIAVCKPESLPMSVTSGSNGEILAGYIKYANLEFTPGQIRRKFIAVPSGSNFLEISINSANRDFTARFYAHIIQLLPQSRYTNFEHDLSFGLNSNNSGSQEDSPTFSKWLRVLPNVTMELCLAQFWSSLERSRVTVEIKFHGIFCTASEDALGGYGSSAGCSEELHISSGTNGFARIDVSSMMRKQDISPSVSLETIRRFIRPSEASSIVALKSRDLHPDSKQSHALELTYTFKLSGDSSVTPHFPKLKNILYESSIDNFCALLFDNYKKLLSFQDIYPKSLKLNEGTYTLKVQASSVRVDTLENLVNMPLALDLSISKSISLPLAASIGDAFTGHADGVFKKKTLQRGGRTCFFIGNNTALPKEAKYGDILLGKLDIADCKNLDGPMYRVQYRVPPEIPSYEDKKSVEEPEKEGQLLKEAVRDLEISWLSKLKSDELRSSLSSKLCTDFPSHLPLHHQNLEIQFDKMDKAETFDAKQCREVIRLSDIVLGMISQDELAKYFGVSHENKSPKDKEISSKKEKEKSSLIYALVAKATAFQKLNENDVASTSEAVPDFDLILKTLAEWVGDKPKSHGRYLLLWSWQQHSKGFSGTCLLPIIKFLQDKKDTDCGISKKLLKIKMNIFEKLGWKVWKDAEARWNLLKFPKDYAIF